MERWEGNSGFNVYSFKRLRGKEMEVTMGVFSKEFWHLEKKEEDRQQEGKLESKKGTPSKTNIITPRLRGVGIIQDI